MMFCCVQLDQNQVLLLWKCVAEMCVGAEGGWRGRGLTDSISDKKRVERD